MSIRLPDSIWNKLGKSAQQIDIRLSNGEIITRCWVNEQGVLEGRIVGGQDGIDPSAIKFSTDQIDAARKSGLFRSLIGKGWIELE